MIVVRNVARIDLSPYDAATKALILQMFCYTNSSTGENITNYFYKDGVVFVPPNLQKLEVISSILGKKIVDERSKGSPLAEPFLLSSAGFALRDYQILPAKELERHLKANQYGVLQAPCGAGKSSVVSYVAGMLGVKVLQIVDQGNLLQSWEEAMFNIWGRKLQHLKASTTEFDDCSITTFQLLHRNPELLSRISKEYGLSICDEAHTVKAETFKSVLSKIDTYYRIGTSATFYSKNLPIGLLEDYISGISVKMVNPKSLVPIVKLIPTGVFFCSEQPMDFASKITPELARNMGRMSVVTSIIKECLSEGRRTIVVCITTEQAKMVKLLAERMGARCELYVGATSRKRDREIKDKFESGLVDFLIVNKKLDKGFDVPSASAIILTRPSNNMREVTQVTGRVVRVVEGKEIPIIYDLVDEGSLAKCFSKNRIKWYKELGYIIQE